MENKTLYAIMTLLLNCYGLPYFLQGETKKGIMTIVSGIITCSVVFYINLVKGIILGIKLLKMTDEEFAAADKSTLVDTITFFA